MVAASSSEGTARRYGVERVCKVWSMPRSTFYARRKRRTAPCPVRRRGPVGPCPDAELVEHIRNVLKASLFHGEGYRKVWARLRYQDVYTSKRRVLRLMREHSLLATQRGRRVRGPKAHDGTIKTARPDVMWGTDMTLTCTTKQGKAHVFIAVDHCTSECVGIHAARYGTRFEALEPIKQGMRERVGRPRKGVAAGLSIRHDHGSAYMAHDFQEAIAYYGMESSPAFVRQPEGNGCAERFIRTLKENLLWVFHFETIEELRLALQKFKRRYNEHWLVEKHGYRTPAQARRELIPSRTEVAA